MLAILRSVLGFLVERPARPSAATDVAPDVPPLGDESAAGLARCQSLWAAAMAPEHDGAPFRRDALLRDVVDELMRVSGPALRRYCTAQVGGNAAAGDDCAQVAFMTFWRRIEQVGGPERLRGFLYGIAYNVCRTARRDAVRDRRLESENAAVIARHVHPERDDVESVLIRRARVRQLDRAIDALDAKHAFIVRMRLVEGADYSEILRLHKARFGDAINTEEGLRTAFFKAKKQLVAELERMNGREDKA